MGGLSHIVCGWYTPDYAHLADALRANLSKIGEPHDFAPVAKLSGGWERNTLRKAGQIIDAMNRHGSRTIIFLDVDCEVFEPLALLTSITGDVAIHVRCKPSWTGVPQMRARTGTLVINPTAPARALLQRWYEMSEAAPRGSVDQRTLPFAIASTPGLSVTTLDVRFCAVAGDKVENPAILHDSASRWLDKVPAWRRTVHSVLAGGRLHHGK